jgi:hypothetical protein
VPGDWPALALEAIVRDDPEVSSSAPPGGRAGAALAPAARGPGGATCAPSVSRSSRSTGRDQRPDRACRRGECDCAALGAARPAAPAR